MMVGLHGAESDEENEVPADREHYAFDEPQEVGLVELRNGPNQLVDERELEVGSFECLQLDIDDIAPILADGADATVDVPGAAPLTFNQTIKNRKDTRTVFTVDVTPVWRGHTDEYYLQPVLEVFPVEDEDGA